MKTILKLTVPALLSAMILSNCQQTTKESESENSSKDGNLAELTWMQNAVIYEVNFPQFSSSGNFKGFEQRLDSIKDLGVDIVFFHSINLFLKGTDGNLFINDFRAINPALGTIDEFRNLVEKCHDKKLKVIIEWEGGPFRPTKKFQEEHPDWVIKDLTGRLELNFKKNEVTSFYIENMKWWVNEFDIDGFHLYKESFPRSCWEKVQDLRQTKKIVIIAARMSLEGLDVFDIMDDNTLYMIIGDIYNGEDRKDDLLRYIRQTEDVRIIHSPIPSLHSKDISSIFYIMSLSLKGIPMFSKATNREQFEFYKTLISIRHKNPALWNNVDGQTNTRVFETTNDVYAFIRQSGENKVLAVFNLSNKTVKMDALEIPALEQYSLRLYKNMKTDGVHLYELGPWGYSLSTLNEPE